MKIKKSIVILAVLLALTQYVYADRAFDEIMKTISSGATEIRVKELLKEYLGKNLEAEVYVADVLDKSGQVIIYATYEKQILYSQYNSDVRIKVGPEHLKFVKELHKGDKISFKGKLEKASEGFITISSDALALRMVK